jgi:DNA repair photolyase
MRTQFAGAENGGKVMVLWSKMKDEFPELSQFPTNTNHELFETLQQLTTEQICIGTRVPPILAGVQVTGKLGATNEIENAVDLLNSKVYNFQQILEDIYSDIFTKSIFTELFSVKIGKLNPFNILPDWAKDVMTQEEKRKYLKSHYNVELDELPSPTNNPI